jgi:hypothetical protein
MMDYKEYSVCQWRIFFAASRLVQAYEGYKGKLYTLDELLYHLKQLEKTLARLGLRGSDFETLDC